ncbi:MAG: hypothetical protein QOH71_357 [Blastocatellia bacterium]|jgi:CSLREA domain-containing protein|nr:hypothetical protein [Blastocatellia bacterium]
MIVTSLAVIVFVAVVASTLVVVRSQSGRFQNFFLPVGLSRIFANRTAAPLNPPAALPVYYSQTSGDPTVLANWNTVRGGGGSNPANFTTAGQTFVIQNGNNMTANAAWAVSGSGTILQIESGGTLTANVAVTIGSTSTFQIDGGGTYAHNNATAYGSTVLNGTESFAPTSNFIINNSSTTGPSGTAFGNLTINFTTNPGNVNCSGGLTTVNGNLTIISTSSSEFRLSTATGYTLTIGADLIVQGGTLSGSAGAGANAQTIQLAGNYNQTGGTFTDVNTTTPLSFQFTGTGKTFTQSAGILTNTNINWTVNNSASLSLANNLPVANSRTATVNGTLNCGTSLVSGAGAFTLASGGTLGIGDPNGITASDITATGGNVRVSGARSFSTGANYTYSGSSAQVTGNGLPSTINALTISNTAGVTLTASTTAAGASSIGSGATLNTSTFTLAVGNTLTNSGAFNVNGVFQINEGGFASGNNFVYATNATLVFNNTSGTYGVNNAGYWPTTNGPQNVTVLNPAAGIQMNVARTAGGLFQYAAGVKGAENLTLNGTCQVNTGGYVSGSPTYGSSSLLKYNTASGGAGYGRNGEWLPGATSGAGYPHDVQISGNTTLDLPNSSATQPFQLSGSLTIDSGSTMSLSGATPMSAPLNVPGSVTNLGTLTLSSTSGGNLNVGGNFTNTGGTFTHNSRTLTFNGGSAQSWSDSTGSQNFGNVVISGSSGVQLNTAITVQDFSHSAGTLNLNGKTLSVGGNWDNSAALTPSTGAVSFFGATANTISGNTTFNNLTIDKASGSLNASGSTLTVTGLTEVKAGAFTSATQYHDVQIDNGATLALSGPIFVNGNWTMISGGMFTPGTNAVTFNGPTLQTISGNTSFYDLTKTVSAVQQFNFAAGSLTTVTHALTLNGAAGQLLSLRSTSSPTQWKLHAPATQSVDYVDVKDGDASGASQIVPTHSVDSGNNLNWLFGKTISGTVTGNHGNGSALNGVTIKLLKNGVLAGTTTTLSDGTYSFSDVALASGDKLAVFIASPSIQRGATITLSGTSDIGTLNIFQDSLIVRSDSGGAIANSDLSSASDGSADLTSVYTVPGGVLTTGAGTEIRIWNATTFAPGDNILDGGDWTNYGTFNAAANTVTLNGNANQTIGGLNNSFFNNLTINNTSSSSSNVVSLALNTNVAGVLNISGGVFDQGTAASLMTTGGATNIVTVGSGGTWRNLGTGGVTLSGGVNNLGTINFNAHGTPCGDADDIQIRSSSSGTQRTWSGTGTFSMTDVDVSDQKAPGGVPPAAPLQIVVNSGTGSAPIANNAGWTFIDTCTSGTYKWIGGANQDWTIATNWTPTRATPNAADVLVFDGATTPSPIVSNFRTETDAELDLQGGVFVTLNASSVGAPQTLTLNGGSGQDRLKVPTGTSLTLAGSSALQISLSTAAGGSKAAISGNFIMQDGAHRLLGGAGAINFGSGSIFTTSTGFTGNPFGATTDGSVIFGSGSSGFFNAGLDPFGGDTRAVVQFGIGSTAKFNALSALSTIGRSYGFLTLGGNQMYAASGASPITVVNDLTIENGSKLTLSGTAGGNLILDASFTNSGTFDANARTVEFRGAAATQNLYGNVTLFDVLISKTGGSVKVAGDLTINGALQFNGAGDVLDLANHDVILNGAVSGAGALDSTIYGSDLHIGGTGALGTVRYLGTQPLGFLTVNRITNGSVTFATNVTIGNVSSGGLDLTNGTVDMGGNTLSLAAYPAITRTNGYVIGNLQKTFGATGVFVFPVGTANGYSPVDANVTVNTSGTLTVKAVQGPQPNITGANALQRYWTLTGSGLTTGLTFHYRGGQPTAGDVNGNEALYKIFKYSGGFTQPANQSVDTAAHTATVTGVTSFSDWTLAEPGSVNPPTLAPYTDKSISLSTDTTVAPDGNVAPTNTTSINVSTSTNFKGKLESDPTTGVVRVTDAHPAGAYTITIKAFNQGTAPTTKSFTLTVTTPAVCNPVVFGTAANFDVGSLPTSVAVGDFDGDGKQDLAITNRTSNNVSILLGDGAGGFSTASNPGVGSEPTSVAVGDFNGDGKQDLAVGNRSSNNVSILLGSGGGAFSAAGNLGVGPSANGPASIAVGDFNGDGRQDLAVANRNSDNVSIFLGDGAGGFSPALGSPFGVGTNPVSVAVGDFNDDTAQDLVVANNGSANVSVLLGDGAGSFVAASGSPFAAGTQPTSVAVGHFDSGNTQDFAIANGDSNDVTILLGAGNGGFSPAGGSPFVVGANPFSVAVGDFDGDTRQDLAVASRDSDSVKILNGDGAGGFGPPSSFGVGSVAGSSPESVAVGDFNGDGKQDLATSNVNANNVSILLRTCCPAITLTPATLPDGTLGVSYHDDLSASGGTGSYTFTVTSGGAPTGLSVQSTGQWLGTPTATGDFTFTVTAKDSATGCTGTKDYTLTIVCPTLALSPSTLPNGIAGQNYSQGVTVTGGSSTSYSFTTTGSLPPGLSLNGSGSSATLSGSPTMSGTYNFTIKATDTAGCFASQDYTIIVTTYTIAASAAANGSINPTGSVIVNSGANQSFTITANATYHVADVLVDGVSVGAVSNHTFTNVTANHTIAASFAIDTYKLTYTAGANGTISGTSPQTVNHGGAGSPVTAAPNTGYHFVNWSDSSIQNPRTDTNVTANISVTANFAPPETNVAVDSGNLIVTDGNGGNTDDTLTISLSGANIRLTDPNHSLACGAGTTQFDANTCEIAVDDVTGNIQVNTLDGSDTLTLDFSGGNFMPHGLNFDGGDPTTGPGDKLKIVGGSQGTVTYNYTTANSGSVAMSAFGTVTYTGLEPISNSGTATDVIFNLPSTGNAATLADDGTVGNGMSRLSAATFETTDFSNPSGSLTINRGSSGDTLVVNALPDFNASLTIGSAGNEFNTITFAGAVPLAANNNLSGTASSISLPNVTSNLATSGACTITLTADSINLAAGSINATSTGTVTLLQKTAGTLIDLGGADAAGTLGLTDAELDLVTAGTLNIGNNSSGTITVSADITRSAGTNMALTSGGDVLISGGQVNTGGGTLLLHPGNSPAAVKPTKAGTDVTASTLSFGSDLAIAINGTTVDTQYTQLKVAGSVNLTGVSLVLSGSYTPAAGDSFTIVDNDGASDPVVGEFVGRPEGSTLSVNGVYKRITYHGGDGNDVVLFPLPPTNLVVTKTADSDDGTCDADCSLREAIAAANVGPDTNNITFNIPNTDGGCTGGVCTITLGVGGGVGELGISSNVNINGPGESLLIVDGATATRVFEIASERTVSISDLTVTRGNASGNGGGILNDNGTLTLTNSTVNGNNANFGGGICNLGGTLTLTNSTVSGNTSTDAAGGIYNVLAGTLTLTNSTVSGNTASSGDGGGFFIDSGSTVTLTNSTVSDNTANFGSGGGIEFENGTLTLTNSTVTGNTAIDSNGNFGNGGGIAVVSSTANVRNTIIADNSASGSGPDISGTFTSQGHNLIGIGDGGLGFSGTGDQVGSAGSPIDPRLGPLANNGGPTQTHALGFGSPAIDAGDDCVLNNSCNILPLGFNLTTDQRGVARPQGNHVDIGAFELKAYVVTKTADTNDTCLPGNCSLREAIKASNLDAPDQRMIVFNILSGDSGCISGVCTITPSPNALPTIVNSIFIDGYSQTGSKPNDLDLDAGDDAVLTIQLNGAGLPNGSRGLDLQNGSDWSVIRGLIINNFEGAGVWLENDGANQISGNFIGANATGDAAAANGDGVAIAFGIFNLIGGELPAERNVISGNKVNGIRISGDEATDNDVEGNYIGTTKNGDVALANPVGVYINPGSSGNVIGCKVINGDNLISGNSSAGVRIEQSAWNLIEGNFIGTDKTGAAPVPNAIGVDLKDAPLNTVGLPKLGNLISGNTGAGLLMGSSPSSTLPSSINDVQGNRIGTNAAGTGSLPNNVGILIRDASDNLIGGGIRRGDRNYISGNTLEGIRIEVSGPTALSDSNQIFGNYIGTNFSGTAAIPNGDSGVKIVGGFQNEVGCAFSGSGNLISGNAAEGVELTGGAGNNFVQGNFIGVKSDLTSDLGNTGSGVEIYSLPNQPSRGNVVGVLPDSGNSRTRLDSIAAKTGPCRAQPERNTLREAKATAMRPARQKTEGARADSALRKRAAAIRPLRRISSRNQAPSDRFAFLTQELTPSAKQATRIGPTVAPSPTPGPTPTSGANVIAFNHHDGVKISTAGDVDNLISQNSIFSNGKLGINLVAPTDPSSGAQEGVTDNDAGDGDDGPNHLQNFPVITDAAADTQTIYGTLDSSMNGQPFTIEIFVNDACDGSGNGEGKTFVASTQSSVGNFSLTAPSGSFTAGQILTATATDAKGNTSEFSSCFTATPVSAGADLYIQKTDSPDPVTVGNDLTYTLTVFSNGPAAANDVQVTDTLPDSVTFVSSTPSQGTCSGTTTVDCNLGTIYNGGTATVKIVVKAPNTPGSISNSASVSSLDDPLNENNTASAGTQVNACPTTFTVNDNGDAAAADGVCATGGAGCTLRAAIQEANALPACGTIDINFSGVTGAINLATALPAINHNININGPGANVLTVKRNSAAQFRIFEITPGRTVAISGLTIANGLVSGIYPGNSGGGIYNDHGSLSLTACVVSGNSATGGAILNNGQTGTASLTVTDSSIRDNAATESGGGIYNLSGTVTVKGSAISNNSAVQLGGGILNSVGGLTLINTTISGNKSQLHGGGIYNYSGGGPSTTTAINVTITNNRADSNGDTLGDGGGIFIEGGNVLLRNTIVARNFKGASSNTTAHDVFGTLDSASSFNLIGDGTGINGVGSLPANNQIGTAAAPIDPLLGVLQDNGGPTFTHALLYNSPAVEKGDNATTSSPLFLTTDQRGSGFARQSDGDRTAGAIVDIGAYERQSTEQRRVFAGANSQVDLVDVKLTFPCVPNGGCGTFKAGEDGPQTRADRNPETRPSASITVIDPAAQPTPPAGYVAGNNSSPPLPAFDLSTTASFDGPIALCFYLPTITDAGFFGGLKLLHNEGGTLVDRTTSQNFASKILCGSVSSLSPFVIAHTVTPTAANGKVSGQIVDSVGHPVEGAGIRMSGTQNRLTVTDANGNYSFDNVETNGFYTVVPSRANYSFSPAQRSFSALGQQTEAAFSASTTNNALNPLDTTEYFVRQQYLDFLGREPDEAGLNFWYRNIETCGDNTDCRAAKRVDTSAAFFLSIEFQQTGYLVYRTYRAAFGDIPGAPLPLRLNEFKPDTAAIGNGVVVNKTGWETQLDSNKQAYMAEFVQRPRFTTAYPLTLTPVEFVGHLFATAGVSPSTETRAAAIAEFGSDATSSDVAARGRALRRVAENSVLAQQEFNQAFVLMQYFGYLRRDANAGQDTDFSGYNFWLDKLNTFHGNFGDAQMVKAFLVSGEYRGRFPR